MSSRFTELETETYYDAEDAIYRTIWDEDGSVHWGFFDDGSGNDFLKACENLNRMMVQKGRIGPESSVLDLGCGNGTAAIWLAGESGGRVTGIDLSGVRVANALEKRDGLSPAFRERLAFEKASATDLPFETGAFTHVWSQAVIYHVPDKRAVLKEAYRVLADGGTMVFDDLLRPKREITPEAQTYVYDRLLFDTEFTFESYPAGPERPGPQSSGSDRPFPAPEAELCVPVGAYAEERHVERRRALRMADHRLHRDRRGRRQE